MTRQVDDHIILFEPPDDIPSINKTAGRSWTATHTVKDAWQDAAFYYAVEHFGHVGPDGRRLDGRWLVKIGLPFRTRQRRDPHNYVGTVVKWMVDGLVQANLWPDDTPEYVKVDEPAMLVGASEVVIRLVHLPPGSSD